MEKLTFEFPTEEIRQNFLTWFSEGDIDWVEPGEESFQCMPGHDDDYGFDYSNTEVDDPVIKFVKKKLESLTIEFSHEKDREAMIPWLLNKGSDSFNEYIKTDTNFDFSEIVQNHGKNETPNIRVNRLSEREE